MSQEGNIFEFINDQVNIVDVISHYVPLSKAGKNYKALCPFHNEKSPSFIVSEEKQLYHCFGCGAAGNSVGFIMQYENLDAIDAVEFLANRYRIDIEPYKKNPANKNARKQEQLYDILRDAAIYFYKNLRTSTPALSYLESRGIDYEVIKTYGLGYSSDAWAELIKQLTQKYTLKALEDAGLVIHNTDKDSYYDRFRNRIMFPIINPQGKVIGFGGRVMDQSLPKYLNSPETDVFNKSKTLYGLNIAKNVKSDKRQLIITEGYMDVIALHKAGFKNAVATLGTALTTEHARLMKRYTDEVILCYDSDFAGQNATVKGLDVLEGIIEKVRVIQLGEGLDPDDFVKRHGSERFKEKLDTAISSTEFRINHLKSGYNLNEDDSKVAFLSRVSPIIQKLDNAFEKDFYIEKLGKMLGVNTDLIAREVYKENYDANGRYGFHNKAQQSVVIPKIASDKRLYIEEQILAYYVTHFNEEGHVLDGLLNGLSFSDVIFPIAIAIKKHLNDNGLFDKNRFIEETDIQLSRQLMEILEKHAEASSLDIELLIHNLKIMVLEAEIEKLKVMLKDAEDISTVQREIHQKILEKQKLTMKMPRRKL